MKALDDLKRSLAWRAFPWARLQLELGPGCTVVLRNRGDFLILREIFIAREYDRFLEQIGPVSRWLDLGCNCGMFSLRLEWFAREKRWSDPRYAVLVDANAEALDAAREAVRLSAPETTMALVLAAVGPTGVDHVDFHEGKTSHKSRLGSLGSRGRRVRRAVKGLDDLAAPLGDGPLDLVKIDIEGAEALLLTNWGQWLRENARHVLIEWHAPDMPGEALGEVMKGLGFALTDAASDAGDGAPALAAPIGTALFSSRD